jgi:hypothetical protein
MLKIFPFMAIVVATYNALALLTPTPLTSVIVELPLPSGAAWTISVGDGLVICAVVLLFVEIIAATSTRTSSIVNHGLSMLVFVVCVVEFLLVPACGTSAFFLITMISLLDVVAGYSVSILTARRDWSIERA